MKQVWQKLFLMTFPLTTLGSFAPLTSVKAQITPDNSLGAESSVVNSNTIIRDNIPSDRIDGGARRGNNLFHSFQEFNVNTGRGAYFSNPTGVDNILTRVTGSNPSNILGRLGVLGNANLFLINPNGIVFGQNASLDVRGSFLASTASSLIFNNGFEFSATNPQAPPLLTVNIPIGLQYGTNPGSITVNGFGQPQGLNLPPSPENPTLAVDTGQTLALVGGNVSLNGGVLQASGGRVELGGLTAAGTVGINNDSSLSFPDGVERASVSLKNSSNVDVSGGGSGSIAINARNLDLQHSSLTANISQSSNTPSLRVGDITLNAAQTITLGQSSQIETTISGNATGNGSNINITTGSLSIMNASEVNTFTSGQGNAGNVNINARDIVEFDGAINVFFASGIVSVARQESTGNAGDININTGTLSLTNGAGVFAITNGQGSTGSVTINARDRVSFNQGSIFTSVNETATGKGGDISITSGDISLANGAQVAASSSGMGNAGNINITTEDAISLDAGSTVSSTLGASTAARVSFRLDENNRPILTIEPPEQTVFPNAQGNSGNINISTNKLAVTNGARLTTSTNGQGNAGNINVNTNTATFSGSTP